MSYLSTNEAYDYATLACWYQNSIDETIPPIWTEEHLEELLKDFYVIPKDTPTADVVPKSEEGAECPTCHGTGRIGTTDWLTKNISKKQLAEEKAKATAEHEQYIKTEYAREIFEEIEKLHLHITNEFDVRRYTELKKKYTEGSKQ